MKKFYFLFLLSLGVVHSSNSQVLISLLLGDKLNSDSLEFGLVGGVNFAHTSGLEDSHMMGAFNLGFYFDFMITEKVSIVPGVLVISTVGAKDMNAYSVNDPEIDAAFAGGHVRREISYFQVPILFKYKFHPRWYTTIGPQLALRNGVTDVFTRDVQSRDDLVYHHDIKENYKALDAGVTGGLGFLLSKRKKSMSVGVKYYQGLVDIRKDGINDPLSNGDSMRNNSIYAFMTIPIGAGKAQKQAE